MAMELWSVARELFGEEVAAENENKKLGSLLLYQHWGNSLCLVLEKMTIKKSFYLNLNFLGRFKNERFST